MTELEVQIPLLRGRGEGRARPERDAILLSAAAHAALVLVLLWTAAFAPHGRGPVLVDLTLPEPAGVFLPAPDSRDAGAAVTPVPLPAAPIRDTGSRDPAAPGAAPATASATPSEARAVPESPAPVAASQERDPSAVSPPPQATAAVPAIAPPGDGSSVSAPVPGAQATGRGGSAPSAGGDPAAGGPPANAGAPPGGGIGLPLAPGSAWAHGMGPLFHHIRESIQKALSYPMTARRMGWQGQVLVAFTVLADGRVRDLRVVRSSGYPLLDRSALETIWSAQPFYPRPPFEARILTPVVYSIN